MGAEKFTGTWTLEKNEGFDDFLKAMGVGAIKRKMAGSATPTLTIALEEGCDLKMTQSMLMKTNTTLVMFGKERTEKNPIDGSEIKATDTLEDDGTWKTVASNGVTVTRDIVDGKLVMTQTVKDVTCRRYFKKN